MERLRLEFAVDAPELDETPYANEPAADYVKRLACAKADEVGARHPDALIVSSDQCAELNGELLGKPGSHAAAATQLHRLSGKEVLFLTGLCLLDTRTGLRRYAESRHAVRYRPLDDALIEQYLRLEQPYNCTASFKSEGLGIILTRRIRGDDPTGLIGLPLTRLAELLQDAGIEVPGNAAD